MEGTTGTGTSEVSGKHRLRIIFDGVIAVGPPPPEGGTERDGPYFGVMARSTRRLSELSLRRPKEPPKYIPMHVPSVYTTLSPFNDGRQPDQVFQLLKGDVKWNIWHPLRERLEFRFDNSGKPGKLTYDNADVLAQSHSPGQVRLHSITKVPAAREISPDRTHLLEGLLSPNERVREEAAAQILIPWGNVTGGGIHDKENGVDVFFESASGKSSTRSVVPNVVISVDVEEVEIATYSLDSGEPLDSLKFQLTDDAEIWVSNGDPSDTAIDLDNLSKDRRKTPVLDPDGAIEEYVDAFEPRLGFMAERSRIREFVAEVFTSGGFPNIPPSALAIQPNRSSRFDIDFELFTTITGPPPGSSARALTNEVPIPVRATLEDFEGPNCLVNQVETSEPLILISNSR